MNDSDKKTKSEKNSWVWSLFRFIFYAGITIAIIWLLGSCVRDAEDKARKENDEREAEIISDTKREIMDYVYDELPPLEDILQGTYAPEDIIWAAKEGELTAEEIAEIYADFYNAVSDACSSSDLYG